MRRLLGHGSRDPARQSCGRTLTQNQQSQLGFRLLAGTSGLSGRPAGPASAEPDRGLSGSGHHVWAALPECEHSLGIASAARWELRPGAPGATAAS